MTGQGRFEATHSLAYMPVHVNRGKAEQPRIDTRACARIRARTHTCKIARVHRAGMRAKPMAAPSIL